MSIGASPTPPPLSILELARGNVSDGFVAVDGTLLGDFEFALRWRGAGIHIRQSFFNGVQELVTPSGFALTVEVEQCSDVVHGPGFLVLYAYAWYHSCETIWSAHGCQNVLMIARLLSEVSMWESGSRRRALQ